MTSESIEPTPAPRRGGLARNAFHLGVGQIATTALSMVGSAAIARTLGAAEFGLLYLLTSISTFAYVFVDWGHGPYVTREIALHPHRAGELMGSVHVVRAGTAAIMCVIAVGLTWLFAYDLRTRVLTGLMILAFLPQYLGLSYGWVFRAHERMEYDALIQVIQKFSSVGIALACLAFGGRLVALIPVPTVAGAIALVVATTLYRRLGLPPLRVSRTTARELVREGAPLMALSLTVAMQSYIDANILYALVPQNALGWYAAAWVIAGTLVAPASIMGAAMYPRLARAATDPAEFRRVLRMAFRPLLLLAVLGAVGTYLFADFAIGVVYSEQKFGPAADILKAFAPTLMLIYIDMLFNYAVLSRGRAGQLATAKFAAVIVTTGLEWVLVSWFQARYSNGGIGVVVAMASGELVMLVAAIIMIRHALDGVMFIDLLRGLAGGTATIVLMRALPPVTPFIGIPLCVLMFAALSTVVGLVRRSDVETLFAMFGGRNSGVA